MAVLEMTYQRRENNRQIVEVKKRRENVKTFLLTGSLLAASASSSQASRTGLRAIMLLCDSVRDSNLAGRKGCMGVWLGDGDDDSGCTCRWMMRIG